MARTHRSVKLLLVENVDNLGIVGDVVDVRAGYARNYLLPHGLATAPTPGAMKRIEVRRAEVERQLRTQRQEQERLIASLEGHEITLQRSANEQGILFGSVTQHDIAEALRQDGYNITERDVRIGEPIKRLDSYAIPIQLAPELKMEIKLWVVSDKPADELLAENESGPAEASEDQTPADSPPADAAVTEDEAT